MKPHEIPLVVQRQGLQPIYLILGEEDYLRDQAFRFIDQAIRKHGASNQKTGQPQGGSGQEEWSSCDVVYGDETDASEILLKVQEVLIFSSETFVVVKWAEKLNAKEGEALIPYIQSPSDSATLVFIAGKLDGRLKWVQALKAKAALIDCMPLFENQRIPWIKQEASRLGVKLTEEAAQALKERAGEGLYIVRREIDKLACYVSPGHKAEYGDVEALQGIEPGASVFDLAGAIGSANCGLAFDILKKNLETGEAPLRILGSLLWQYRRIWKAREALINGLAESKVARSLGIPPFRQREFFLLVRQFSEPYLQMAFGLFQRVDSALKGGSAGTPDHILQGLLLQLCGVIKARG